jgi:hypothetical protein
VDKAAFVNRALSLGRRPAQQQRPSHQAEGRRNEQSKRTWEALLAKPANEKVHLPGR